MCLILTGWKDIHDDWLPLKNGSLRVTAATGNQEPTGDLHEDANDNHGNKGLNDKTFVAVHPSGPQGAAAGVASRKRDAGGASGAQRRGAVLDITHRHGLRAESSLPS